jgi:hypothetical protein
MIKLELSGKMLTFTIEAIEYRIAAYDRDITNPAVHEDCVADMSNDRTVLRAVLDYLTSENQKLREAL